MCLPSLFWTRGNRSGFVFHPGRDVSRDSVLPASEPQKNEPQIIAFRVADLAVHEGKIEFTFLGFGQFPIDDAQDGVDMDGREPGPDRLQVIGSGGIGIAQFSRQHQKRLAIDDQLGGGALLLKMGNGRGCAVIALSKR